jgi:antitoxin component HigA of HigAB toxin-antitoxin module
MKTARHPITFNDIPKRYADLVNLLAPRPIHDAVDEANVEEIVFTMAGHKLTRDQADYLELMSDLLASYQDLIAPAPANDRPPLERLRYLLEVSETTPTQLAALLDCSQSLVSMLLTGKRELSKDNILKLARHFKIEAGYLM